MSLEVVHVVFDRDSSEHCLLLKRRLVNLDKPSLEDLFFFNLFTWELINLPQCELAFKNIVVSCPSTLDNCVVVEIRFQEYFVTFTTRHLGEIKWVTKEYRLP